MRSMIKRAVLVAGLAALVLSLGAGVASAKNTKFTFNDVTLTDADGTQLVGEIEAGVKDVRKHTSIQCTYFTDDYREALGYYFDASPVAEPTESDVLEFCLAEFPNRFS